MGAGPATPGYGGWRHSSQTPQCAVKKTKTEDKSDRNLSAVGSQYIFFPNSLYAWYSFLEGWKKGLSVSYYNSVCQDFFLFGTGSNAAGLICVCRWGVSNANV